MPKKITSSEYIAEVSNIHRGYYDYSNTHYIGSTKPLTVICPHHGMFLQIASYHKAGNGCTKCGIQRKSSTSFISQSTKIHDGKYDYTSVDYINTHTKVRITCPKHGMFEQRPMDHLKGIGCKLCGHGSITSDEFVSKSKQLYGDVYLYEHMNYINTKTPVTLNCIVHGLFDVAPINHLIRSGCDKCMQADRRITNRELFIQQAVQTHDNRYSYEHVRYIDTHTKVAITCPNHGIFFQKPNSHVVGEYGCKQCNCVGGYDYNRLITDDDLGNSAASIYLIRLSNEHESFIKVGITKHLASRLNAFNGYKCELLSSASLTLLNAFILEQNILKLHQANQYTPSIKFGGYTECLLVSPAIELILIDSINNIHYNDIQLK